MRLFIAAMLMTLLLDTTMAAQLRGRVLRNSTPAGNVKVTITNSENVQSDPTFTDKDGFFRFDGLALNGTYILNVSDGAEPPVKVSTEIKAEFFDAAPVQLHGKTPARNLDLTPAISILHTLPQNWTDAEAITFYNTPIGSELIPYVWFLFLEQPDSQMLFRSPENIRTLGYLPRTADPVNNPDGLPIGFVKDGKYLGLTCAACHTSEICYKNEAWLIDGGPTMGDFEMFQRQLVSSLEKTLTDSSKFDRFCKGVIGTAGSDEAKSSLKQELTDVTKFREGYNTRNLPQAGAPQFGPGRCDAFGAIMNEVTSTFAQVPDNYSPANAPVSYPVLWDTPQQDKLQWNGSAQNVEAPAVESFLKTSAVGALSRNVGEVLGVFGKVDATDYGPLNLGGYPSSIRHDNLISIEDSLRNLWSPLWPNEFGPVDQLEREKGKELYDRYCEACHDSSFDRASPKRFVRAIMKVVNTDPLMASNFATRTAKTGILKDRPVKSPGFQYFGTESKASDMLVHMVQRILFGGDILRVDSNILYPLAPQYTVDAELKLDDKSTLTGAFDNIVFDKTHGEVQTIRARTNLFVTDAGMIYIQNGAFTDQPSLFNHPYYDNTEKKNKVLHFDISERANAKVSTSIGGFTLTFSSPVAVKYTYKARPLNGIWASAPYLHNGSVPNLDALLRPPNERPIKFKVGSTEFDPENVGFRTDIGTFEFDASLPGNSNLGHDYPIKFSHDERRQLIAYIKSL